MQRRPHGRAPHRRLPAAVMCLGIGCAPGCGELRFVPSPYTPTAVEVIYSEQEDVTVIRWRIGAPAPPADTVFELARSDGIYEPVDFAGSVFPGGVGRCGSGQGSCAQLVVTGRYPTVTGQRPVRAAHARLGSFAGAPADVHSSPRTLGVQAFFAPGNRTIHTVLDDAIGGNTEFVFPRAYQRAIWATSGLCVAGALPADADFTGYPGLSFDAPSPLTDAGFYCVAARPLTQAGQPGVEVPVRVATLPEVAGGSHVYRPPVEVSPVLYQLVMDLEIPVADRCGAAIEEIENGVRAVLGAQGAPLHALPTVDIARDGGARICHQSVARSLDAPAMAQAVKDLVLTSLPERHQRYHVIYFNNLRLPPPETLTRSFDELRRALLSPYDIQPVLWSFGPDEVTGAYAWDRRSTLLAADDPGMAVSLREYADPTLPFKSELHDPEAAVVFMDASEAAAQAGRQLKICHASPPVTALARGAPRPAWPLSWAIEADDPPAYLVDLTPQVAVPESAFVGSAVLVRYEICSRYCDHPYRSQSGTEERSWVESTLCMGTGA